MLLSDIPAILPSPAEAVEQYPLVRYVPWRADHSEQLDWEDSDLPDHEVESWNACCEICRDDYTAPDLKNEASLVEEPPEPLRKLPCEHAYHQVCIDLWLGLEEGGDDPQDACPTCRRRVVDHNRAPESAELLTRIKTGQSEPHAIAISRDGGRVFSGGEHCSILTWDLATGQIAASPLLGHDGRIRSLSLSPDGLLLASGSTDATIRIWDAVTGLPVLGPLEGHDDEIVQISFSRDGSRIASNSADGVLCVWDVRLGQIVVGPLDMSRSSVNTTSLAPNGTTIACVSADGWITLLDAATGQPQHSPTQGLVPPIHSLMYAHDGTLFVSSRGNTRCIWRCTCSNGSWDVVPLELSESFAGLTLRAISPDGASIVATSDKTICVLDIATGTSLPILGHTQAISDVVYAPSGSSFVSCSKDTIRVWSLLSNLGAPHTRYVSAQERAQLAASRPDDTSAIASVFGPPRSFLVARLPDSQKDHHDKVFAVQISLDSTLATTCWSDGTVRRWNIRSVGDNTTSRVELRPDISCAAIAVDGACIAYGFEDGTVAVRNAATGARSATPILKVHQGSVTSVAFSPDGRYVASGSADAAICVWEVESGRMTVGPLRRHSSTVYSVTFSPDGKLFASSSSDAMIRLWDANIGQAASPPLEGHDGDVHCVAFSPDGLRLVSGGKDKTVRLWDVVAHRQLAILRGHREAVLSVSFSPDCRYAVSGSKDETARMWDLERGRQATASLREHDAGISCVVFSTDGTRLVTSDLGGFVYAWAVAMPSNTPLKRGARSPLSASSQDTTSSANAQRRSDTLLLSPDAPSLSMQLDGHSRWVWGLAVSPDSRYIASSSYDGTVRLWDAVGGRAIRDPLGWFSQAVCAITFSADSAYLAAASTRGIIRIWEMDTGQMVNGFSRQLDCCVSSLAYSPDGLRLAAAEDEDFTIWDVTSGTVVMRTTQPSRAGSTIEAVTFSPNGAYFVTGHYDGTVRVWNSESGRQLLDPIAAHSSCVCSVVPLHDSSRFITCSDDGTVHIWDPATGEEVGPDFTQAARAIRSISLSPDGNYLVGGSDDGNLAIWDVSTGQYLVQPFQAHREHTTGVAFTPDGSRVVSCSDDCSVRVWTLRKGHPPSITSDVNEVQDATQLTSANISTEHIAAPSLAVNDHYTTVPDSLPSTRDPGPPSSSSPVLLSPQLPTVQVDSFVGHGDTPDGVSDPIMSQTQPAPTRILSSTP